MSQPTGVPLPSRDALLQMARDRAGLSDFGDTWFLEPMDQFLAAANREAAAGGDGHVPGEDVAEGERVKGAGHGERL